MVVLFIRAWANAPFIEEHALSISEYVRVIDLSIEIEKAKFGIVYKEDLSKLSNNYSRHSIIIGSPIWRFGIHDFLLKYSINRFVRNILNHEKCIDIVHLNVRNKYTIPILFNKRLQDSTFFLTEHFSFYHRFLLEDRMDKEKIINSAKLWFNNEKLKKIFPVSKQLSDVLISDWGVDEQKIKVVPNVANPFFHYTDKSSQTDTFKICMVAFWEFPKNPFLFFDALSILNGSIHDHIFIEIVGDGSLIDEMKNYTNRKIPNISIKFSGRQDKHYISKLFSSSDLFVHPSDMENLPTVIIESLCVGCPVLSNKINGIPELINNENGRLSNLKDPKDMSVKLAFMIQNINLFDRKLISKKALKMYSRSQVGKLIVEEYGIRIHS